MSEDEPYNRTELGRELLPGKTTKSDAIARLGPPESTADERDCVLDRDQVLNCTQREVLVYPTTEQGGSGAEEAVRVRLRFDSRNRLVPPDDPFRPENEVISRRAADIAPVLLAELAAQVPPASAAFSGSPSGTEPQGKAVPSKPADISVMGQLVDPGLQHRSGNESAAYDPVPLAAKLKPGETTFADAREIMGRPPTRQTDSTFCKSADQPCEDALEFSYPKIKVDEDGYRSVYQDAVTLLFDQNAILRSVKGITPPRTTVGMRIIPAATGIPSDKPDVMPPL